MSRPVTEPMFEKLTWEEARQAALQERVIEIPVAAIEQHGPHLPVDTDNLAVTAICSEAARREPSTLLCAPPIHYGFNEHNMDFPGTITVDYDHFVQYVTDVANSFARQGFTSILFVNGHGSNAPLLDIAPRLVTLHGQAKCASCSYWDIAAPQIEAVRESEVPGGIDHACEMETSLYLYLDETHVKKDRIQRGVRKHTKYIWGDLLHPSPVKFKDYLSKLTTTGVGGDPTLATAEKGRHIFEAAVVALIDVARDLRDMERGTHVSLQAHPAR